MWPRWLRALGCGLALAPVGCFLIPNPPTPIGRKGVFREDTPTEQTVAFDTRLVEQPADDPYLARELWGSVTDPLPHPLSALLSANGLRVGVISGPLPADFDSLATGKGTAVTPTLRRGLLGKPKAIPVNGPLDRGTADVTDALTADARRLSVTAADCGLVATATAGAGGSLTLRCQLVVRHGEKQARWVPTDDGKFDRADDRPTEDLPTLAFEVTLAPSDTLVVGPTAEADDTLGGLFFFTPEQAKRRVLVLRAKADR